MPLLSGVLTRDALAILARLLRGLDKEQFARILAEEADEEQAAAVA